MKPLANGTLFFYQGNKLITVKKGNQQHTIFRTNEIPLAEKRAGEDSANGLLATDEKGSVLTVQEND